MKILKNILPESIIQRMQNGQKLVADSHNVRARGGAGGAGGATGAAGAGRGGEGGEA